MTRGFTLGSIVTVPAYRRFPSLDWIWNRLEENDKRLPTTSSAALPSRSARVAVQVPWSVLSSLAGCARTGASPAPRTIQHINAISRYMVHLHGDGTRPLGEPRGRRAAP